MVEPRFKVGDKAWIIWANVPRRMKVTGVLIEVGSGGHQFVSYCFGSRAIEVSEQFTFESAKDIIKWIEQLAEQEERFSNEK